jgi:hypothetical protein
LDAYLESFARTGAKALATINFKPRLLFPEPDHNAWRPKDVEKYQKEMALQGRRAATAAKIMLTMLETPLDYSFYFLLWDNVMFNAEFSAFFAPDWARAVMYQHWNEKPHRFGLFSESGRARPQYFLYQMLARLGNERLQTSQPIPGLAALATRAPAQVAVMIVNYDPKASQDQIIKVHFSQLTPA